MSMFIARFAVLAAFAIATSACAGNGSGGALPFVGPPNNGGTGTFQPGGTGVALLRFIQGSPDSGNVDVCIDGLPFGVTSPATAYGSANPFLYSVAAGIPHTVAVYPFLAGSSGAECSTAPGPYIGTSPIAVTTITPGTPGNPQRETIVLGGTAASGTRALYVFGEPSYVVAPTGVSAVSHNASPAFSSGKPTGVGFGICTTTVTPCSVPVALSGAQSVKAPKPSTPTTAVINGNVQSALAAIPAGFYDGIGVLAGTPVPITSVPAPAPVFGQPYTVNLYSLDAPAGGLNLLALVESTVGYGF